LQLEPQSTALFILLMVVFCALLAWLALTRQPVFRVFAACLSFIPAMLFGVAAVNKYYDYYQTWGAIASDVGGQGLNTVPSIPRDLSTGRLQSILGKVTGGRAAALRGETVRLSVTGPATHITRAVYVFLPPQYFQPAFSHWRFPAIELISGYPGQPQDWINVMGVVQAYRTLLQNGAVKPAVLIMPDPNGGMRISLQCLNVAHGPQDATFMAKEVPDYLARTLRLQRPGLAWGIVGYSEGGYCAANLALVYPDRYGYAGVLSGYFRPFSDRLGNPSHLISPFGKNVARRRLNTPLIRAGTLPVTVRVPKFWLGAGSSARGDVTAARAFEQALLARQPDVILELAPGGAHTMATWRALIPPLLEWMTPLLQFAAQHPVFPHGGPASAGASPAQSPAAGATKSPRPSPSR
jgi:S-formylglutathione hydrolase FrmB